MLLEQGADVNAQTRSGKASSLHRAAYSGHTAVVKLLIKYGADLQLCDSDGQTPLHKVPLVNKFNNQNKGDISIPFIYSVKHKLLKNSFRGRNPQRPDLLYLSKLLLFSELSN